MGRITLRLAIDKMAAAQGRLESVSAPPPAVIIKPDVKPPGRVKPPPPPLKAPRPKPAAPKPSKPAPAPKAPKPTKAKPSKPIEAPKPSARELAAARKAERLRKEMRRQQQDKVFEPVIEVRQMLFLLFPAVFSTDPAPLAMGIREEILEATAWDKAAVNTTLAAWTSDPIYLRAVLAQPNRLHLDGTIDRPVTDADRANAKKKMRLHLKRIGVQHDDASG